MKIAVMQPYFFPYIGYYQLAYEVDKFIFFDDVNFIKKGYISRNSVLLNGARKDFSVPVLKISQNRKIVEHNYVGDFSEFINLMQRAYAEAPFYRQIMPIISEVVYDADLNVARKNAKTIIYVFEYLGLSRKFCFSSQLGLNDQEKGQDRILKICEKLKANEYKNAIGGRHLYDFETFQNSGIHLNFIKTNEIIYNQGLNKNFEKNLSIIDILMNCEKERVVSMLKDYYCV